jgi:hypothetical protein
VIRYLAARLCESWSQHHVKFAVVEPAIFDQTLAKRKLTIQDLKSPEHLKQIAAALGVEAVVLGTLTDTVDGYLLTVTVRTLSDGEVLFTSGQALAHSRVLDSLGATSASTFSSAPGAGSNGVGPPSCTYTPTPAFPVAAKKAKVHSAVVVLMGVVTQEGEIKSIRVIHDPGYGFAERAVEKLAEWRCRPARNKDNNPVAVTIPIEISFRE